MSFINPIELLQLNYYDLDRLSPEAIDRAAASLRDKLRHETITINEASIDEDSIQQALSQLKSPDDLSFYYHLSKYPGLTVFLYDSDGGEIEEDALRLHADHLAGRSAAMLEGRALKFVTAAFQDGELKALTHFHQQIGKGGKAFQEKVYQSSLPLLEQRSGTVQSLSNAMEAGENIASQLKGLQLFREHIPVDVLNALPTPFADARNRIRKQLGRMVHMLSESDTTLALAIARYALRINGEETYTKKLAESIAYLQRKNNSSTKAEGSKTAGIIMVVAALVLLGAGAWYTVSLKNKVEATLDERYINDYERIKEKEQFQTSPGAAVGQEFTHLPWYERGDGCTWQWYCGKWLSTNDGMFPNYINQGASKSSDSYR